MLNSEFAHSDWFRPPAVQILKGLAVYPLGWSHAFHAPRVQAGINWETVQCTSRGLAGLCLADHTCRSASTGMRDHYRKTATLTTDLFQAGFGIIECCDRGRGKGAY